MSVTHACVRFTSGLESIVSVRKIVDFYPENDTDFNSRKKYKVWKKAGREELLLNGNIISIGYSVSDVKEKKGNKGKKSQKNVTKFKQAKKSKKASKKSDHQDNREERNSDLNIMKKYETLMASRKDIAVTAGKKNPETDKPIDLDPDLETADTVLVETNSEQSFNDDADDMPGTSNSGNTRVQARAVQRTPEKEKFLEAPKTANSARSERQTENRVSAIESRFSNPEDYMYLDANTKMHKDVWEKIKGHSDSLFVREIAQKIWGTEALGKRCLNAQRANKNNPGEERKPLTPEKYETLKDCLYKKLTDAGVKGSRRLNRMQNVWSHMRYAIYDARSRKKLQF